MDRNIYFLAFACLTVTMAPPSIASDLATSVSKLLECCPTMPLLVTRASVNACMSTVDKKNGFHMFGGSPAKNRNCVLECAFDAENLLTTMDNGSITVNLTTVEAKLGMKASTSKWQNILSEVKMNCTAKPPVPSKTSIAKNCTSGALELSSCLYKYLMTLCPERINTADCTKRLEEFPLSFVEKLKSKLKKKTTTTTTEAPETTTTNTTTISPTTVANVTETTTVSINSSTTVSTTVDMKTTGQGHKL